jgi:hypothetical protein
VKIPHDNPEYSSPESNLNLNCAYYMGEIAMSIKKVNPRLAAIISLNCFLFSGVLIL